jgi:BirA family biotin operon repressor/biotin-[acetyl-CoA-carboxylase] ligase
MGERGEGAAATALGSPRLHLRRTDSTNARACALAIAGAPHGTLVTAAEQTAGRGRQGRTWAAPPASALLCSLVLRDPPSLLSLIAGVAVCDTVGPRARVKWPNDVVVETAGSGSHAAVTPGTKPSQADPPAFPALAKLAGILVEGRPQEGWAVLGIGVNVAVRIEHLPDEVRAGAASLERLPSAIEPLLADLLVALARRTSEPSEQALQAWRARDALLGREISWGASARSPEDCAPKGRIEHGRADGIDNEGRLLVRRGDGAVAALSAGEVHLASVG